LGSDLPWRPGIYRCVGFLRGGEFLYYSGSARTVLKHKDVFFRSIAGRIAVCLRISQPKNLWWIYFATVTCFCPGPSVKLSPVTALRMHRRFSNVQLSDNSPAFVLNRWFGIVPIFYGVPDSRTLIRCWNRVTERVWCRGPSQSCFMEGGRSSVRLGC
jgi:hypothetical protein